MSELTKTALANMQAKRIKRIEDAAKRSQTPDIATYQGKSTIDGTDIVQVGANEPTSGFRLTSNAPVSEGEKVSLRPSAIGGLQRVDARNKPIEQIVEQEVLELFFARSLIVVFTADAVVEGNSLLIQTNFNSGGSNVYSNEFFSLVGSDFADITKQSYKLAKIPQSSSFSITYQTTPPNPPVDLTGVTINIENERTYTGSQWKDSFTIVPTNFDEFELTSVAFFASIYTYTLPIFGGTYESLTGKTTKVQKISNWKKLGRRTYPIKIYSNNELISEQSVSFNWSNPPIAYENLSGSGVLLGDPVNVTFSSLSFPNCYFVSSPIL